MNEAEWLARLDAFETLEAPMPADVRALFSALELRVRAVIEGWASRMLVETQANARRLDTCREAVADLRTIVKDLDERLRDVEGTREVGGGR